ncbi:MAG: metallophosphoesterase [Simkaniaceae bacterium]
MVRIAHLSDLHFSKYSWDLAQLFSKRWIGNLNLLLGRGDQFLNERPFTLLETLKEMQVTHVIISGDLTTTSYKKEYLLAQAFVETLKKEGMQVFLIPGNHDHYTKKADRTKAFYHYFPSKYTHASGEIDQFSLSEHGVTTCPLTDGWRLVLLDTTVATPLTSSEGFFSPVVEKNLTHLLSLIDPEEKILLVNHFPFFQHDKPKRRLERGQALQTLIASHPNIHLYLHGHTHRRTIADLRPNGLPLILDSGSTGHQSGSWNLLQLQGNRLNLSVFQWKEKWNLIHHQPFQFDPKPWYAKGLRFKCTGCGKCCTGPGFVWLEEEDVKNLSHHLNLSEEAFFKKYTRQLGFDYSLKEDPQTTDCIFLKDKKFCEVYAARPKQCRTFPWWPDSIKTPAHWNETKSRCEGIDHEEAPLISFEEIKKNLH